MDKTPKGTILGKLVYQASKMEVVAGRDCSQTLAKT
jgi:hypothetical protein